MSKRSNFLTNYNRGNIISKLVPRQLCSGSIVICSAFTTKNHAIICINNISNCQAFPSCIYNVCSRTRNILTVFKQATFSIDNVYTIFSNTINKVICCIIYIQILFFIVSISIEIHSYTVIGDETIVNVI